MDSMASQISSLAIVYSAIYLGGDQRKHRSSASLAFVRWSHIPAQMTSNAENVSIWWRQIEKSTCGTQSVKKRINTDIWARNQFLFLLRYIVNQSYNYKHIHTGISLTHWGRDKMAAVSQTTPSNAFSRMKMLEFRLRFHGGLFLRVQLTIFQRGSDNGLAPVRRQATIWTNDG